VNRISAVQSILDVLKREILTTMKPGDMLPNERALAERFDVGRNTVREAMIFLEAYGLVEKTQRGARVGDAEQAFAYFFATFDSGFDRSLSTYRDLVEFRRHLELGILGKVFDNATDADIADLSRIVDRMAKTLTASEAAAVDYEFHARLVTIGGNSILKRLYRVMRETLTYYMEIGKPKYAVETESQHRQIVDALRARSRADFEAASRRHFDYSEAVLHSEIPTG
jgi:DNA-binding FadR family transcriptional regulator